MFTLVAGQNPEGYGIPVAFCLSRSAKKVVLIDWISRLLAHIKMYYHQDYSPNVVLMDQGIAEFDTITAAFPSAKIFYCYFHVLKAITGLIMRAKDNRPECLDEAGHPVKRLMVANAVMQAEAVRDVSRMFFSLFFYSAATASISALLSPGSLITLTFFFMLVQYVPR